MAIICQTCEHENEEGRTVCEQCEGDLIITSKYKAPVKMLTDIASRLIENKAAYTQESIEQAFNHIMQLSHELMDDTQKNLEKNIMDLENLPEEEKEKLGGEISEDKSLKIFSNFAAQFNNAQENIIEGLFHVKEGLKNMTSLSSIESGKGRTQFEKALELMENGLENLEIITEEAEEKLLNVEEIEPLPEEFIKAMDCLEQITNSVSYYISTRNGRLLEDNIELLQQVKGYFETILKNSPVEDEEDSFTEEDEDEEELEALKNTLDQAFEI